MTNVYFDFESRSSNPIRWGVDNYFLPARPLILTYAVGDGPVQLIDYTLHPTAGERYLGEQRWSDAIKSPAALLIAHNCPFDRRVLERLFKTHIPMNRYRCTQAQAYAHGLPGSLETLGEVLNITQKKLTGDDGHALMLFFCTPRSAMKDGTPVWNEAADHPEKWEAFKRYAIRDTEALREVYRKLPTWNYRGMNLDTWFLDQKINERGVGFDSGLARAAVDVLDRAKVSQKRYASALTNGVVGSVTQRQKLLDWFNASGLEIASMKASDIREALEGDDLPPAHRFLLELRLEGSKSSGAKYKRGLEMVGPDGRLRDTTVYCGANRTGRWAGRGFAPHNLARPSDQWEEIDKADPWRPIEDTAVPLVLGRDIAAMEAYRGPNTLCNDVIRSALISDLGSNLTAADWSNIEGRVLAWLAGSQWELDYFAAQDRGEAADAYKHQWAQFFGMDVEDVTKRERQASKQVKLACQFLGSTGAMVTMALGNGLDLDDLMAGTLEKFSEAIRLKAKRAWRRAFLSGEDFGLTAYTYQAADALVRRFREINREVTEAGYGLGAVAVDALHSPNTLFRALKCDIWYNGHALIIQLPCGRRLFYWSPQLRPEIEFDVETGKRTVREVFWFKSSRGKQWRWQSAWPGLFTENVTQATANSVLRAGMLNVQDYCEREPRIAKYLATLPENARTPIVLTVHDEVVCELPTGMLSYQKLEWLLTDDLKTKHQWMSDLPLAASGWSGYRYRK